MDKETTAQRVNILDKKIKAVAFDYGNVITEGQNRDAVVTMQQLTGLSEDKFNKLYNCKRPLYDRGSINAHDFWSSSLEIFSILPNPELVEQLIYLDDKRWSDINPLMIQWVEHLKNQGYTLAIISNMPFRFYRKVVAKYSWISLFDVKIISGELQVIKPEPQIYKIALQELKIKPTELLFIDDLPENIKAARQLGIQSIWFHSYKQARPAAETAGVC